MALPYLGCYISLITKANVRYEGRLFGTDPKEATTTLLRVRMFGTENRNVETHVPPTEVIDDYKVFNNDDIMELSVLSASASPGLADPAVKDSALSSATRPLVTFKDMKYPKKVQTALERQTEQQSINSLYPAHLQSSYPAE